MSKEDAMKAYLKEMKESLEDAPYEHELTQQLYKICDMWKAWMARRQSNIDAIYVFFKSGRRIVMLLQIFQCHILKTLTFSTQDHF